MRVVLDTGILIAALITVGTPVLLRPALGQMHFAVKKTGVRNQGMFGLTLQEIAIMESGN